MCFGFGFGFSFDLPIHEITTSLTRSANFNFNFKCNVRTYVRSVEEKEITVIIIVRRAHYEPEPVISESMNRDMLPVYHYVTKMEMEMRKWNIVSRVLVWVLIPGVRWYEKSTKVGYSYGYGYGYPGDVTDSRYGPLYFCVV